MILDSGSVDIGLESTILDMTVEPPMILRPGAITADMFEEVIGPVSVDETILGSESNKAPKAPGMKYRHYAPKAKADHCRGGHPGGSSCNPSACICRTSPRRAGWNYCNRGDTSIL